MATKKTKKKTTKKKKKRRSTTIDENDLDYLERIALVCKYFCQGFPPGEIQKILRRDHKISISREAPYRYLAFAAKKGWIQFVAPLDHTLRERLKERFTWLDGVEIVHTSVYDDVANKAADMLVELLRARKRAPHRRQEVHIGFAGGHVLRRMAERFASLLRRPLDGLPESVVFHALVAGFNVDAPATAPNAFFTYFANDPAIRVKTSFVGLSAPSVVETEHLEALRRLGGIDEAATRVGELDIIVTSVGSFSAKCNHSLLQAYMQKSADSLKTLEAAGYLGDMLWRPLGPDGPIKAKTKIRAMTLIELGDLPGLIDKGTSVLLVVGPCRVCNEHRAQVLETILRHEDHLVTHVVGSRVDQRPQENVHTCGVAQAVSALICAVPGGSGAHWGPKRCSAIKGRKEKNDQPRYFRFDSLLFRRTGYPRWRQAQHCFCSC